MKTIVLLRVLSRCRVCVLMLAALAGAAAAAQPGAPRNLSAPPLGRTATTVLLLWERAPDAPTGTSYQIVRDGQSCGETTRLSFTATNLAAGRSHRFSVRSRSGSGSAPAESSPLVVATKPAGPVLDARDQGARSDGITKDTAAIQAAIAACPPGAGLIEQPVRTITFENVTGSARTGFHGENLDGVTLRNVRLSAREGPPFTWVNVKKLTTTTAVPGDVR